MRFFRMLPFLMVLIVGFSASGGWAQTETEVAAQHEAGRSKPVYTLSPEKLKQAIAYTRKSTALEFVFIGWGIVQLVLLLWLGIAARMRDVAIRLSGNRWVQCFVFVFLLLLVTSLLNLPLQIIGHRLAVEYGQSVQHWGSWLADKAKEFGLTMDVGGRLVLMLWWLMKK